MKVVSMKEFGKRSDIWSAITDLSSAIDVLQVAIEHCKEDQHLVAFRHVRQLMDELREQCAS